MGAAVQLMGIIRTLLDPENMLASVNKSEKTDFLNHFYKHCMHGKFFLNCLSSSGFIGLKCDFIQTKKRL